MTNGDGFQPTRRDAVSAASGGSVGVLLVWMLQLVGVSLNPAAAATLAAMITAGAVAVGHDGIRGIAKRIWKGEHNGHDPPKSQ